MDGGWMDGLSKPLFTLLIENIYKVLFRFFSTIRHAVSNLKEHITGSAKGLCVL